MKRNSHYVNGVTEYILNWNDTGAFRHYPPKFEVDYADRLPDPTKILSAYYSIVIMPALESVSFTEHNLEEVRIKRVNFAKIELSYRLDDTITTCFDWEQID